ncbi:MAG: DUF5687 family protein [Bacteroidota bacterium]
MLLFFRHQLLGQLRSVFWQKNLIVTILTSLFFLYLFVNLLLVGFFADTIIEKIFPGVDVLQKANQLLLYYFIVDLIIRFIIQKLPDISIQYYSLLPIKKAKLLHFPILGSLFSPFNVLPAIIMLIFCFKQVIHLTQWYSSISWLLSMILIVLANNLINFGLKKRFRKTPVPIILLYIILSALLIFEGLGMINFSIYWLEFINMLIAKPFLLIIPIFYLLAGYFFSYHSMKSLYYPSDKKLRKSGKTSGTGVFSFLRSYGSVGRMVEVELKLILRNKRPRTMLMLSVVFAVYIYLGIFNLSAISGEEVNAFSNIIMIGFFLLSSGWSMLMYGQLLFAWESNHFDGIISRKISHLEYLTAKYWLTAIMVLTSVIFIVPALIVSGKAFLIGLVCLIFNLGVNSYIIIFAGMFNTSKVEPNKTAFMNYQGSNVIHFFIVFLIMGIPAVLFLPFQFLGLPEIGTALIALVGISGFVFRGKVLEKLAEFFRFRKYKLAKGYKEF